MAVRTMSPGPMTDLLAAVLSKTPKPTQTPDAYRHPRPKSRAACCRALPRLIVIPKEAGEHPSVQADHNNVAKCEMSTPGHKSTGANATVAIAAEPKKNDDKTSARLHCVQTTATHMTRADLMAF